MANIYHITHFRNLQSIMECGCLWCDNERLRLQLTSQGIAHQHIKERRARKEVPVGPGGHLADYVPFYFAPRSPMLFAIHKGIVEGYNGGQEAVLHLVSSALAVNQKSLAFVFTDGHAEVAISTYYNSLKHLNRIDWDVMNAQQWANTQDDQDRKRRRQAEFLVHRCFPLSLITGIGVNSERVAKAVKAQLAGQSWSPVIDVRRDWYYD